MLVKKIILRPDKAEQTTSDFLHNALSLFSRYANHLQQEYPSGSPQIASKLALMPTLLGVQARFFEQHPPGSLLEEALDHNYYLSQKNIHPDSKEFRADWIEYFMLQASMASLRSSCFARRVGAVIVKDHQVISTGYNGAPRAVTSCYEQGHCVKEASKPNLRKELRLQQNYEEALPKLCEELVKLRANQECISVCAERNALSSLASSTHRIGPAPTSIFISLFPCQICATSIVSSGINHVYYLLDFNNKTRQSKDEARTRDIFEQSNTSIHKVELRPQAVFSLLFNFIHPLTSARELEKPNEE